MAGKCLIFSAPSGSGKSTIVNSLLSHPELKLTFSVSATSRQPRGTERDGVEYIFITEDEFRRRIAAGEFLEYEEVYQGCFYGTLKEQVESRLAAGFNVVFDVDVEGGCNIKNFFADRALSVFIMPPSVEELRRRLIKRGTDSVEMIEKRVAKANYEIEYAPRFDITIINDDMQLACQKAYSTITNFLKNE
ncbi:MAG: guanylate kinase [Bacteroidaceae bacterium]|nr:guanylate kinase [Bacteroidaceae bacterium]